MFLSNDIMDVVNENGKFELLSTFHCPKGMKAPMRKKEAVRK